MRALLDIRQRVRLVMDHGGQCFPGSIKLIANGGCSDACLVIGCLGCKAFHLGYLKLTFQRLS